MPEPRVINSRYALKPEIRSGGMADIYKAYDIHECCDVAVKLFRKGEFEDEVLLEAYDREVRALRALRHPHIVKLKDEGVDLLTGSRFLVLEWMPSDVSVLLKSVSRGWDSFYTEIGRPLLKALAFAHSRQVIHRDVKPRNVLLDDAGVPKLADFGISKIRTWLEPGLTLNEFVSRPFCPPEIDDGSYTPTRDVFGFAALAVQCLHDKPLTNHEELYLALDDVDLPQDVYGVLKKALSVEPAERHINAAVFLCDLEVIQAPRDSTWIEHQDVYLELSSMVVEKLRRDFPGYSKDDLTSLVIQDLNTGCGILPYRSNDPDSTYQLQLYGASISCHVAVHRTFDGHLVVINASRLSSSLLEEKRQRAFQVPLRFKAGRAPNNAEARATLLNITQGLEEYEAEQRARDAAFQEQELFRTWDAVLRMKRELERQKERPLRYRSYSVEENRVTFTLLSAPEENVIGQLRHVSDGQRSLVNGEVGEIDGTKLTLYVERHVSDELPTSGELIIDNWAGREAIRRQKDALDAIRYDRAIRPDLRLLLVHPDRTEAPKQSSELIYFDTGLDPAKREAVAKAVGTQDFLVVQGPPGTGKTTFITEVIRQTLANNPRSRILLTSQTHVALDNAVERLARGETPFRIVRVGKSDNSRISKEVEKLLLDNQMESWRDDVLERGREYLRKWATENGIPQQHFQTATLLRQLASAASRLGELAPHQIQLEKDIAELRDTSTTTNQLDQTQEGFDDLDQLEADLAKVKKLTEQLTKERKRLASDLRQLEPENAAELLNSTPQELDQWADTYLPDSPVTRRFQELVKIHSDWESRFGRVTDFEAALISASQVVAGTCVGVAAIRSLIDIEFDLCIVDEASKATPTETLVPLSRARRWIFVGDSKQLPPFLDEGLNDKALLNAHNLDEAAVTATLFSRLQDNLPAICTTALSMQHRMVPEIGNLIADCFYPSQLESAPKKWDNAFQHILPKPVVWLTTAHLLNRHQAPSGLSYTNPCEARLIYDLLIRMNGLAESKGGGLWTVLVITGYAEQKQFLNRMLAKTISQLRSLHIECNTVDAVQGREADVAIYSVTRSNPEGKLGFLRETRRLNVALSRGRQYLTIVGDHYFCQTASGENPFRRIVEYVEEHPFSCALREYKN